MSKDIRELYEEMGIFSIAAFPDADSYEHLLKLEQEAVEAQVDADNIDEYADCLLVLFGAAFKAGISWKQLFKAAKGKLEKIKYRDWEKQDDGTYQHVKAVSCGECNDTGWQQLMNGGAKRCYRCNP